VEAEDLDGVPALRSLKLEGNKLRAVPTEALQTLPALEVL